MKQELPMIKAKLERENEKVSSSPQVKAKEDEFRQLMKELGINVVM